MGRAVVYVSLKRQSFQQPRYDVEIVLPCELPHRAAAEDFHVEAICTDDVDRLGERARDVANREEQEKLALVPVAVVAVLRAGKDGKAR